jgi:hypothetical protein
MISSYILRRCSIEIQLLFIIFVLSVSGRSGSLAASYRIFCLSHILDNLDYHSLEVSFSVRELEKDIHA